MMAEKASAAERRQKLVLVTPPKRRVPKSTGAKIDLLYRMREQRMEYGRKIREAERQKSLLEAEEHDLATTIHTELRDLGLTRGSGKAAVFSPEMQPVYSVEDWESFYQYIAENDAFEMLHRRISSKAVEERIQQGLKVPGVKQDQKLTFSLTKRSRGRQKA